MRWGRGGVCIDCVDKGRRLFGISDMWGRCDVESARRARLRLGYGNSQGTLMNRRDMSALGEDKMTYKPQCSRKEAWVRSLCTVISFIPRLTVAVNVRAGAALNERIASSGTKEARLKS